MIGLNTPSRISAKILLINCLHKPPACLGFKSMGRDHPAMVEPFQFLSPQGGVAYEGSSRRA